MTHRLSHASQQAHSLFWLVSCSWPTKQSFLPANPRHLSTMASDDQIKKLRNNLTLDFTLGPSQTKPLKYNQCLLTTPDLQKVGLSTPELDSLAMNYNPQATPVTLPTFIRNEDSDEEKPKLENLWANVQATKSNHSETDSIKVDSKKLGPINMEDQERIKLERKRYRNRIAASKCRQRKLERISKLEKKVSTLKSKNSDLVSWIQTVSKLNEQLNNHIVCHREMGCDITVR